MLPQKIFETYSLKRLWWLLRLALFAKLSSCHKFQWPKFTGTAIIMMSGVTANIPVGSEYMIVHVKCNRKKLMKYLTD